MPVLNGSDVYIINLPDGCTPGRLEAGIYFAEAVAELRKEFPGKFLAFATFDHEKSANYHGVKAWLVVVQ